MGGNFSAPYRPRQIRDLLAAREGWRAEDMPAVQKDVYSGFSLFLARQMIAAYARRRAHNPRLEEAVRLLREWNGQMEKDSAAALVVTLAFQRLRHALVESAAPGKGIVYGDRVTPAAIERLLRVRPEGWFRDWDEMLLRALAEGVEEGRRTQGDNVARWAYGNYVRLTIAHPVTHRLPLVGGWFDIGPVPMSGSATTVKQTSLRLGPSMRMSADLADWERSLLNVAIGQSGHALSRHYKDEWAAYYAGRSFPMRFERVEAKGTLRLAPYCQSARRRAKRGFSRLPPRPAETEEVRAPRCRESRQPDARHALGGPIALQLLRGSGCGAKYGTPGYPRLPPCACAPPSTRRARPTRGTAAQT